MNGTDNIKDLEIRLNETLGGKNPFLTPEGYFEAMPQRTIRRIKRQQRKRLALRWAAAAVFAAFIGSTAMMTNQTQNKSLEAEQTEYIEDALDYSMIGNIEIAYYLTEAE